MQEPNAVYDYNRVFEIAHCYDPPKHHVALLHALRRGDWEELIYILDAAPELATADLLKRVDDDAELRELVDATAACASRSASSSELPFWWWVGDAPAQ